MKKIVVKIGSSIIAPKGKLDSGLISRFTKDILAAEKKGYKVILVSSGAIACGLNKLGYKKRPHDTHSLMAISSLGQIVLMDIFNAKFRKHKKTCAQILLTWDDFDNRKRFINICKTVDKLLAMGVIPIINENDAVFYEEIGFGDNDRLSALVANLVGAEQLIILSDVEGLLEDDMVVKRVTQINEKIRSLVREQVRTHTSGGMDTKLEAATIANLSGIKTRIAYGRKKGVIQRIISGEDIGTLFVPLDQVSKARKRWINFSKQVKGYITIDDGAKEALINKGKSLLSVGIIGVTAGFKKGDAVWVVDKEDNVLGRGIVNYSADRFKLGKREKLEKEVIHRDNFVKEVSGWCYHSYRRCFKK